MKESSQNSREDLRRVYREKSLAHTYLWW